MRRPGRRVELGLLLALWPSSAGGLAGEGFTERAAELGIVFIHRHFGRGDRLMPETMGAGVALFDADGDGLLDIYLVQGRPWEGTGGEARNRLFRQRLDGRFEDFTDRAGVGDDGYGMGVSWGDVEGDGDADLYVTNYGSNVLYLNRGDGSFTDITTEAGVGGGAWSTASGFFDPDADGDLDLFVVNYLAFETSANKWCGSARSGVRTYCHPDVYDGVPDVFYRNLGDRRFTEASAQAGVLSTPLGKGLGVLFADLDEDGDQDVYVANDGEPNHLYLGDGRGRFREAGVAAGVAVDGFGAPEASMGVALGDVDGDGRPDLLLTHLDGQTNTLYRGLGEGLYHDATQGSGLAAPSRPLVGFGTALIDHDNDGDLDLFVANGHILDNIHLFAPAQRHAQPAQLFDNVGGGRFRERTGRLGLGRPGVGRGVASGDLDRDGDVDIVVTQNGGEAWVLINRHSGRDRSLTLRLRGRRSNPHGFGARLEVEAGGRHQRREVLSASSYLSQGDSAVVVGVGDVRTAEVTIHWPSGRRERYRGLEAGLRYVVIEKAG